MKQCLLKFITMLIASMAGAGYVYAERSLYDNAPNVPTYNFTPDFQVDGLYYEIVSGGVQLTRAEGNSETVPTYQLAELTVPESVTYNGETYPVVGIGKGTFLRDKDIKIITFPEGLKSIGERSFNQSTIETFNFPTTLQSIGERAFDYCQSLTSVVIPDNVQNLIINNHAFAACNFLTDFTIGLGVVYMGEGSLGAEVWVVERVLGGLDKFTVCTKLKNLYSPSENPPFCGNFVPLWYDFRNPVEGTTNHYYLYYDCVVHVPPGCKERYNNNKPYWNIFKNVVEDPAMSSIDNAELGKSEIRVEGGRIVAEGHVEVYDLGGRKVAEGLAENLPELPAGFYIVRTPTATAKVVL